MLTQQSTNVITIQMNRALSDADMLKYQCKTTKITYEFPVDCDNVWNSKIRMQKLPMEYCQNDSPQKQFVSWLTTKMYTKSKYQHKKMSTQYCNSKVECYLIEFQNILYAMVKILSQPMLVK